MKDYELIIPIGDFDFEYCLTNGETAYLISKEDFIKLAKHELKWSTETYEEDSETKSRPILIPNDPTEENAIREAHEEIAALRAELAKTDYIVTKIAECETEEEKQALRNDEIYAKKLVLRKQWRARINELQEMYNLE